MEIYVEVIVTMMQCIIKKIFFKYFVFCGAALQLLLRSGALQPRALGVS